MAEKLILTNGPWIEAAWDVYLWHLDLFFRPYNQLHMARGLQHVRDFLLLQEDAIAMNREDFNGHYQGFESIEDGLKFALNQEQPRTLQELIDELPELAKESFNAPFVHDPDPGPESAWRWAHRDSRPNRCVCSHIAKPLRSCGYVFWDQERLQRWHLFDHPWEPPSVDDEFEQQKQKVEELGIKFKEAAQKYADRTYGYGRNCFIDW